MTTLLFLSYNSPGPNIGLPNSFIKGIPFIPKNGLFSSFTNGLSLSNNIGSNSSCDFGLPSGPINIIFPFSSNSSLPSSPIKGINFIPCNIWPPIIMGFPSLSIIIYLSFKGFSSSSELSLFILLFIFILSFCCSIFSISSCSLSISSWGICSSKSGSLFSVIL